MMYSKVPPKEVLDYVELRSQETRRAIKDLGIRRTPSGEPRPTEEQARKKKELQDAWWHDVSPFMVRT